MRGISDGADEDAEEDFFQNVDRAMANLSDVTLDLIRALVA